MSIKLLYSDLDGTMVGPGGCFFRAADTTLTIEPTVALLEMLGAGVDLVLVSGRTRAQLQEAARMFGAHGCPSTPPLGSDWWFHQDGKFDNRLLASAHSLATMGVRLAHSGSCR